MPTRKIVDLKLFTANKLSLSITCESVRYSIYKEGSTTYCYLLKRRWVIVPTAGLGGNGKSNLYKDRD